MASRFLVPLTRTGGDPLFSIYREMNRMFDDVFSGAAAPHGGRQGTLMAPSLDVHEKDNEFCIAAELPGTRPEDVDLRLDRDVLTISGEKKADQDQQQSNQHFTERSYGRFSRSMQLPFMPDPNQISAEMDHGVLKIRMKRDPKQPQSHRIEVRSNQAQKQPMAAHAGNGNEGSRVGAAQSTTAGRSDGPSQAI